MSDIVRDNMKLRNPEAPEAADATNTSDEAVKQLIAGSNGIPAFAPHNDTLRDLLRDRNSYKRNMEAVSELAQRYGAERDRLREALWQLLTVMPVFPDAAKKIVGMEDRYNAALDAARAALKETGHE